MIATWVTLGLEIATSADGEVHGVLAVDPAAKLSGLETGPLEVAGPTGVAICGLKNPDVDATAEHTVAFKSVAVILPLSSGTETPGAVGETTAVFTVDDEIENGVRIAKGGDGEEIDNSEGIDNDEGVAYDRLRFELCVTYGRLRFEPGMVLGWKI